MSVGLDPRVAAVEQFLAGFKQALDFIELGGANKGQFVEAVLKHAGLAPGNPWCAALVSYVGFRSFMLINPKTRERKSSWPLPNTGGCVVLAEFAAAKNVLMKRPQRGDVFLKWHPELKRFAHAGAVDQVIDGLDCMTFEGNTTFDKDDPRTPKRPANAQQDEREGWGCAYKHRPFTSKDRFIRWSQLMTL